MSLRCRCARLPVTPPALVLDRSQVTRSQLVSIAGSIAMMLKGLSGDIITSIRKFIDKVGSRLTVTVCIVE